LGGMPSTTIVIYFHVMG